MEAVSIFDTLKQNLAKYQAAIGSSQVDDATKAQIQKALDQGNKALQTQDASAAGAANTALTQIKIKESGPLKDSSYEEDDVGGMSSSTTQEGPKLSKGPSMPLPTPPGGVVPEAEDPAAEEEPPAPEEPPAEETIEDEIAETPVESNRDDYVDIGVDDKNPNMGIGKRVEEEEPPNPAEMEPEPTSIPPAAEPKPEPVTLEEIQEEAEAPQVPEPPTIQQPEPEPPQVPEVPEPTVEQPEPEEPPPDEESEATKLYQEIQGLENGMVWTYSKEGVLGNAANCLYFDSGSDNVVATKGGTPMAVKNPIKLSLFSGTILPATGKSTNIQYSTQKYSQRKDPREDPQAAVNTSYIQKTTLYGVSFPDVEKATSGELKSRTASKVKWSDKQYIQFAKSYIKSLQKAKAEWDKPIVWSDNRLKYDITDVLYERFHR